MNEAMMAGTLQKETALAIFVSNREFFFETGRPEYLFPAAAKLGGIRSWRG